MEKIYMNNNQRQKDGFFQSKIFYGLASLAIVSLLIVAAIVVVGFDKPSYAIPTVDEMPDTFITQEPTQEIVSDTKFTVVPYYVKSSNSSEDLIQVYCWQHKVDFRGNTTFGRGSAIADYGMLSLMAILDDDSNFMTPSGEAYNPALRTWMTQVAIWLYLNAYDLKEYGEVKPENALSCGGNLTAAGVCENDNDINNCTSDLCRINNARGVMVGDDPIYYTMNGKSTYTTDAPLLVDKIVPLVQQAIEGRKNPIKILKINMNDGVSLTSDNKYYQSNLVTINATPASSFNGYSVSFAGSPDGTFAVDLQGNKIDDLSNLSPGTQFYVRVPVDKVTNNNKVAKISVTGSFKALEGYLYTAEGAQTISAFRKLNTNVSAGKDLDLTYTPRVPDTGMSTAQTIYFIGLIVLLSGVGVIYANVKPAEQK